MLSVLSVLSVPSVGSVGKFSNNKIGGVVSVLLLCLMTAKYVLQGTGRFVGIILCTAIVQCARIDSPDAMRYFRCDADVVWMFESICALHYNSESR